MRHAARLALAAVLVTLGAGVAAQAGRFIAGANLGSGQARRAGDVDDDGVEDLVFDLGTQWEVRSGATGLAFPLLTQARLGTTDMFHGLGADLDADGCDDLCYEVSGGSAELRSGRDGTLLFAFTHPYFGHVWGAADFDADGADDVLVAYGDPVTNTVSYAVLSGAGGRVVVLVQFSNSAFGWQRLAFAGDADGDGYVDLVENISSFGQQFFHVWAGPDRQRWILGNANGPAQKGADTNGDGRDELLTLLGYLDAPTNRLVWPGFFAGTPPLDIDGDGAMDLLEFGKALSGRTHAPFATAAPLPPMLGIGDIDGDGRDEALDSTGTIHELVGVSSTPAARDRGACGATSTQSRPRIRHHLRPRLGGRMRIFLNGGLGGGLAFLTLGAATDVDLAPLGAPGNRSYVQPITGTAAIGDGHGLAAVPLAIPAATAFLGLQLSLQWAVLDPGANALGVATSNALDLVIGS